MGAGMGGRLGLGVGVDAGLGPGTSRVGVGDGVVSSTIFMAGVKGENPILIGWRFLGGMGEEIA